MCLRQSRNVNHVIAQALKQLLPSPALIQGSAESFTCSLPALQCFRTCGRRIFVPNSRLRLFCILGVRQRTSHGAQIGIEVLVFLPPEKLFETITVLCVSQDSRDQSPRFAA